jgi:hypothetical protein
VALLHLYLWPCAAERLDAAQLFLRYMHALKWNEQIADK